LDEAVSAALTVPLSAALVPGGGGGGGASPTNQTNQAMSPFLPPSPGSAGQLAFPPLHSRAQRRLSQLPDGSRVPGAATDSDVDDDSSDRNGNNGNDNGNGYNIHHQHHHNNNGNNNNNNNNGPGADDSNQLMRRPPTPPDTSKKHKPVVRRLSMPVDPQAFLASMVRRLLEGVDVLKIAYAPTKTSGIQKRNVKLSEDKVCHISD
jgi:hypothetical protein